MVVLWELVNLVSKMASLFSRLYNYVDYFAVRLFMITRSIVLAREHFMGTDSQLRDRHDVLVRVTNFNFVELQGIFSNGVRVFRSIYRRRFSKVASLMRFFKIRLRLNFVPKRVTGTFRFMRVLPNARRTSRNCQAIGLTFVPFRLFMADRGVITKASISPISVSPSTAKDEGHFGVRSPNLQFLIRMAIQFVVNAKSLHPQWGAMGTINVGFGILCAYPRFQVQREVFKVRIRWVKTKERRKDAYRYHCRWCLVLFRGHCHVEKWYLVQVGRA